MKKFLLSFLFLVVGIAYADNTITSKEYVDGQVATLQTQIPAKNTNTVITNTGTAGTIGEKAIYDTTAAYGTQSDALVTAGAFNSAVQNALESEFVCVEWQGSVHDNAHCLLYEVRGATQMQTLPAGYTQLEYLESTGTQYIDTGIQLTADTLDITISSSVEFVDLTLTEYSVGSRMFYGSPPTFGIQVYTNGPNIFNQHVSYPVSLNTRYRIITTTTSTMRSISANNIKLKDGFERSITDGTKINVFGTQEYTAHNAGANIKLYEMQISKNSRVIRNFVPAQRDSDGELGMYDTVSNTFFTNSGTGEFVAGPVFSYLSQNQQ
ncbi:MAG: hypothetical protein J5611_01705 [Alphaproteobacteria bacterium]|nr:hypothetical protein [Alphaproteobacteria bacterium]